MLAGCIAQGVVDSAAQDVARWHVHGTAQIRRDIILGKTNQRRAEIFAPPDTAPNLSSVIPTALPMPRSQPEQER
jgi:hypothetical protein